MDPIIGLSSTSGYSYNLEDFVESPVEITDSQGNPVTNYYLNSDYYVEIIFSETALLQFEYFNDGTADYMTYQLPSELKVQQSLVDKSPIPIIGLAPSPEETEPIIGYIDIDINGFIKVHFDDVDIYGNPALVFDEDLQDYVLVNFIDYYSDAAFMINIAAQFSQIGSDQEINFGNDVIVTVTVESPLPSSLDIEKEVDTSSAITDKTVTYTVTITASNDTVHDITLNDLEQPGINGLLKQAVFSDMSVSIDGDTPYTPPEFAALAGQIFGDGFALDFSGVTLSPNQQIVVTFTLDIADLISQWVIDHPSDAGEFSFDFTLYNRAIAQGLDEYDSPTPSVTADNTARILRQFLTKAGTQDLTRDYTAWWSGWYIGDGVTSLNGYTITDTFTGLVFNDNNLMPNGENGVYLLFRDKDSEIIGTEYLTVPTGATGFSFTVPDDIGIITFISLATAISTTVADISDFDDVNTVTYFNTISVDIDDPNPSYTAEVSVLKPGRLPSGTKSGTFGGDGDEIDYVEWTYTLYVPKEAYGQRFTLFDDSFVAYDGLHRLYPRAVPENLVVTVYSDDLGERTLTRNVDFTLLDLDHTNGYSQVGNTWYMYFIGDTTGLSWGDLQLNSLWPFDDDTWLTMTFRLPLNIICDDGDIQMTFLEALQRYDALNNYLYINSPLLYFDIFASLRWPLNKTATVTDDTIKYQIVFTTDDFDFNYTDVFTDTFDPMLEYVPFSMRVWKSGSPMYGLYEMVDSTFTDMLAESLVGNTISFDFTNMYQIVWDTGGASYYPSPTLLSDNPISGDYYIEYTLKLKDDTPLGEYNLTNNVSLDGFTNFAEATIGQKVVDKTMSAASNIASVSIIINPGEKTLAGSSGQYTITDILSDTLLMYITTTKIESWDGDTWVTHTLTASRSGDIWTYTTAGANQISFVVPDSTMLRVTYNTLIKGVAGDTVIISNQVTVAGEYQDAVEEAFLITDTSASGSGTRTILTVTKYDADEPEVLLNGAIFALYIGVAYSGRDAVNVPSGIDKVITIGTVDFYYVSSGVTGGNGQLVLDNQWLTPTHGAVYALKEYQSALGYDMPTDPIRLFSYTVPSPAQQEALAPYVVQQVADTIAVPNTKQSDTIIQGYKAIIGDDSPGKIFTFRLTQIADASGTDMPDPYTDTTTTLGQGVFGFPLANLDADTTYYYKITEDTDPTDPDWIYDTLGEVGQIVTVAVDGDGDITISYPNEGSNVTFTNEYRVQERPTNIILSANKVAVGAALLPKRFLFGLFNESGDLIDTATNE